MLEDIFDYYISGEVYCFQYSNVTLDNKVSIRYPVSIRYTLQIFHICVRSTFEGSLQRRRVYVYILPRILADISISFSAWASVIE